MVGESNQIAELWRHRFLLRSLVKRNLRIKYQRSALGFLWTFLNPLLMVGILIAIFSVIIRIPIANYWAFILSGYFVWNTLQHIIFSGSYVLSEHVRLTRNVAFPREILLFGAACSRLIEFSAEIVIIAALLLFFHHKALPPSVLLLPLLLILQFMMAVGIMLPIAIASTLFQDVQHALPVALTSLFYLTPVFYPAEMVPDAIRPFYFLNPLAGLLTLFHQILYEGRMPSPALLLRTTAAACLIFLGGYVVFRRYEAVCNELM